MTRRNTIENWTGWFILGLRLQAFDRIQILDMVNTAMGIKGKPCYKTHVFQDITGMLNSQTRGMVHRTWLCMDYQKLMYYCLRLLMLMPLMNDSEKTWSGQFKFLHCRVVQVTLCSHQVQSSWCHQWMTEKRLKWGNRIFFIVGWLRFYDLCNIIINIS